MQPFFANIEERDQYAMALPALMIVAGELASRGGDILIFNKFGLTVAQYSTLRRLASSSNPPSMTELKESVYLMRSASSITAIIDDFERRDLVQRVPTPSDRRVNLIAITDAGRELFERVNQHYVNVMRELCADYALDEMRCAVQVLRRFSTQLDQILGLGMYRGPGSEKPADGSVPGSANQPKP